MLPNQNTYAMKFLQSKVQSVAVFLAILLLSQGCTVYKGSISLEEAVASKQKVKVTTSEYPKPIRFSRIEQVDGEYVGMPKRYGSSEAVILQEDKITQIKEHDKTTSNIITFSPLALIIGLGIILFSSESEDYNGG